MELSTSFGSPADGAEILAVVDDYQYLAVRWVMRRRAGEQLDYYCPLSTWMTTPAGQLAVRDATIACLRTRVAELEAILAGRDEEALAAPATDPQPAPPTTAERKLPAGRVQCPHCSRQPWANKLGDHLTRDHPEQLALAAPAPVEEPAAIEEEQEPPAVATPIVLDDSTWRCRLCQGNAFAPGLRDITICMRCEASTPAATNGHLVAA
jgi:hypothetical protein